MATGGKQKLDDKDMIKIAQLINPETMLSIALEHLEFQKNEIDQARANAQSKTNPILEYHFDLLAKWKHKKGKDGTRENLYACLMKASKKDGSIDGAQLAFLKKLVIIFAVFFFFFFFFWRIVLNYL